MPTSYSAEGRSVRADKSRGLTAVRGFSLIEVLIVVSIMFIAAAVVIPTASTALRGIRLSSSGASYADLLQQARVRAVRDDRYYSVISVPATSSAPGSAFVDLNGNGKYDPDQHEPEMVFAQSVTPKSLDSGPALTNLELAFLPPGQASVDSVNAGRAANGPTFGPRGLPCTPTTTGGYTTCPFLTATSYVTFIQNTDGGAWEAVTVTPAGRIREWRYDGTNWSPLD
jgi:prepilin-type N-terminal cleavage/methylation domain-containing protein